MPYLWTTCNNASTNVRHRIIVAVNYLGFSADLFDYMLFDLHTQPVHTFILSWSFHRSYSNCQLTAI